MELPHDHIIILKALLQHRLLTEHELSTTIADQLRLKEVAVQATIGKTLVALRDEGLIWAGQLFNTARQTMWAAALTKAGREKIKYVPAPRTT